jgi:hypothetical protein
MTRVLIMDQFKGPSPYSLRERPMMFEAVVDWALAQETNGYWRKPEVTEVEENFIPPYATTVYRANPTTGVAEVWKYRWDSSG